MNTSRQPEECRVVITGIGMLSPLGIGADAFWQKLSAGESGIGPIQWLKQSAAPNNMGGEVWDFDEKAARKTYLSPQKKTVRLMCREIQLGVASANLAVEHAGLDPDSVQKDRFGVEFGANLMLSPPDVLKDGCWKCVDAEDSAREFHYERWGSQGQNADQSSGMQELEPLWLLKYLPNMPACHISIGLDARGPSNSMTMDDASGNLALAEASRIISRGRADAMIAGSTGTRLHPVKTIHAQLWEDVAHSEKSADTWCRPFDKNRNGHVVAEAACSFIVESESHAKSRGAVILAEVLGSGCSCVVDRQGKPDLRRALAVAMQKALEDADLEPRDIGHINAHGIGSQSSDALEALAILDIFGKDHPNIPVTALKSYFGNSGSGNGLLELAGSVLGLREGIIPPTRNFETPDPNCPLNIIAGKPLPTKNRVVLNINVTIVGQASAAIVRVL
jgi:3-oxoacyl-[acyl-carrier-protein] synthase II